MLSKKTWNPNIDRLCRDFGVTHIVIHRNYPYPKNIPLNKITSTVNYDIFKYE